MRAWQLTQFGIEHLKLMDVERPRPGPGEVLLDVKALSLNYRDLMVVRGLYNPKLALPAVPVSDGAGVITAVGEGVSRVRVGDGVMSHFIAGWIDGPFDGRYPRTSLGTPGPGLAAEQVVLSAEAVVPLPRDYDFAEAATLPIAALTAWSALVTEGCVQPDQTVLTLGTGGVSIFTVQIAKALGARVIITSSSDEKLARVRDLGADVTINYRRTPEWDTAVLEATDGRGADLVVETGGAGTLNRSMRAARAGGIVAVLGALTGLQSDIQVGLILMKRLRLAGIYVDSRASFEALVAFIEAHALRPVIDRRFHLAQLPAALEHLAAGAHFGKVVIDVA